MPYILARPCEPQHKTEELTQKGATLSLYQEEEESSDADKKPLPHDDIFCWCNTKSCKQLKRRYRRKQLSWEKNTYFCPSPLINPSDYSKVILKLFNLYFAQYTNYQKTFFQNMLSWGSSVTVGHHCSGTLTAKKRGDPSQGFELKSDDKHAFSASPTSGSDPRKNVQAEHHALNKKIQLEKKDGTGKFSQRVHALCSTHTLETEDTQPYDSGDELPDITFPMTQRLVEKDNQGMESQQGSKDQIEVQTVKNEKSSVSSESLGFIFCEDSEECPHLSSSSDSKLTLLEKQQQNSSHKKNRRDPENLQISRQFSPAEALEQKEIRRKRKQNNPTEDNVCSVDDDDFEILFLQKKKHSGNKKRQGEVYATGQKRPASTKCTEDNSSQLKKMALSEGSSSLSGSHSQDSLESALGRRAESDKVMDKEGKRGYFEGPEKQAENDVYISKIAYRDPSSTRQRRNLTQKGYRQNEEVAKTEQVIPDAEGPNTKFEVEGKEQSEVQCPMCFKSFPKDVVEEHAYICQGSESLGDISNDRPHQRVFPQRSKTTDLLLMPLTRQPIHDSDYRVPTTCTICEAQVLGQRAYQQHYRRCLKRTLPTQQHLVKGGQLGREQNEFDVPMSRHVALRDNPETSKDMSQDMAEDSDSDLHSDDATNDPDFIPTIKQ
ncbi:uncharacterized protein LOC112564322 isoform X3 [Pomacea canaliculata]|uniref:uncharacterized protein LOC112564322 isoform X3 n=1 Tax=Pomacea canaliculata TaxID=400727 RepID=UPI000D7313B6|nr:uncharacterized protein LOC112564322 isoform X3 [Pomacea canaliculata]